MSGVRSGFTLVELLVVFSLLVAVSLAVYGGVASGVRIWKSIDASIEEIDFMIGWRKFRKDLVDHISFRGIEFSGTSREVSFPGLVTVKDEEGLTHQEVGRILYRFDASKEYLCRETTPYRDLIRGLKSDCQPVLTSLKNVVIKYYGSEEESGGVGSWSSGWQGESAPIAVRLAITFEGTGEESELAKEYTATLP